MRKAATARHAAVDYQVAFVGFQPGFAYLDGLQAKVDGLKRLQEEILELRIDRADLDTGHAEAHAEIDRLREVQTDKDLAYETRALVVFWLHELGNITEGVASRLLGVDRLAYRERRNNYQQDLNAWGTAEWAKIKGPKEV